jgi:hypothetical protein
MIAARATSKGDLIAPNCSTAKNRLDQRLALFWLRESGDLEPDALGVMTR